MSIVDPPVWVPSSCDSNWIAWRASISLPPSLSSIGLFWRAAFFFLGALARLRLGSDPRFGGPIFGLVVGVGIVEDSDGGVIDVVALGNFVGVLAVG